MRKNTILFLLVILGLVSLFGCKKEIIQVPDITATINVVGKAGSDVLYVHQGDNLVYNFKISSLVDIKKIELWKFEGRGINRKDPESAKKIWEYPLVLIGKAFEVSSQLVGDTIKDIMNDVQYAVYVQDMNGNYTSGKASAFLDLFKCSQTIYDAKTDNSSASFLNIESAKTYFIANTIADPQGIDMGFAYLEKIPSATNPLRACLISFDEYWKVGTYAMVKNELNASVTFKKGPVWTQTQFFSKSITEESLVSLYNTGTFFPLPAGMNFTEGKIATDLLVNDVVIFKTKDNRYGMLRVNAIDRKNEALTNDQNMQFDMVIVNKQ